MPNKLLFGGWAVVPEAKTASATIKPRDCGKVLTNRGAGASITLTLPKAIANLKGFNVEFFVVAGFTIVIASDPADTLVARNDAAADTITLAAVPGQHARVICDGTGWLCEVNPGTVAGGLSVDDVVVAT